MIVPSNPILTAALEYARRGWHVFPARFEHKNGKWIKKSWKSAKSSNGQNWGMTIEPDEIRLDFQRHPDAIGVPTGKVNRIFVVEADTKEGHEVDGIASLKKLETEHGALPDTLMAVSPSGSVHRYLNYPANVTIQNSRSEIGLGVDLLGEGGMVIAPPSLRPDGGAYRWLNDNPIADPPQWLLVLAGKNSPIRDGLGDLFLPASSCPLFLSGGASVLGASKREHEEREGRKKAGTLDVRRRTESILRVVERAVPGTRNGLLFWATCTLRDTVIAENKLDRDVAVQLLISAATVCGLVRDKGIQSVLATIRSGLKRRDAA